MDDGIDEGSSIGIRRHVRTPVNVRGKSSSVIGDNIGRERAPRRGLSRAAEMPGLFHKNREAHRFVFR
jgi:hypothetical protein